MRGSIFMVALFLLTGTVAHAQTGKPIACPTLSPPFTEVTFNPSMPRSTDAVAITILPGQLVLGDVLTDTVNAEVVGSTITITLRGTYNGLGLTPVCGTVTVGPLSTGNYTVNYLLGVNGGAPTLKSTFGLLVADPIPTLSLPMLVAVAGLLLVVGAYVLRRRA